MLEWIFGNAPYKVAAILVAIGAWLYVQSDEMHIEPVKARIDWTMADGVVSVDALPTHITLQVLGTRAAIRRARRGDITVEADLRNIGPGQHALEFAPMPVGGLPSGLEVRSHAPSGVRFSLDRVGERRVEIRPQIVGQPAPGFTVASVEIQPPVVSLRGANSKIDSFTTVRTEPIDVTGLSSGTKIPAVLDLPQGVEPAEAIELEAAIEVLALNEQRTFSGVPVHVWGTTSWQSSVPLVQVVLQGPAAVLRELSPEDVTVFLHPPISGVRTRQTVTWKGDGAARMRVLHAAGDQVEAISVTPKDIELVPR